MEKNALKLNLTTVVKIIMVLIFLIGAPCKVEAQLLKKLQKRAEDKIEREAEKRAQRRIDKGIDKGFDEIEDTIDGKNGKKTSGNTSEKSQNSTNQNTNSNQQSSSGQSGSNQEINQVKAPTVVWSKFDFIPGETVIFEDGPSTDEENGEFPSRWDLHKGNAEIGNVDGENVIMFLSNQSYIVPYLKNSKEDYLPDVFTLELDVWFAKGQTTANRLWIILFDKKNQKYNKAPSLVVMPHSLEFGDSGKRYPGTENIGWSKELEGSWKHISIAYTKGKFKAYFDDTRLINVPHLESNPTGITIEAGNDNMYIKNVRIAKGGVKYYDRVLSEGKIIVNGIKFDTNKATLKAESMGPINKIYQLMEKNPDLNFSVEGHTDSDGGDAANMTLSKARGKSVMNKLIAMGISPNRLKSTGFGESKPLDSNSTPEGKANNRRVEFVKFTGSSNSSFNNSIGSNEGNSAFDKINYNTIDTKWDSFPDSPSIPISNNSGIVNGKGTIIIYGTSDGNLGKMEILNVDKNDNYKLTVKYVTYGSNGNIYSESNNLEIPGTYTCDLDKGTTEDMIRSDEDFWYQKADSNTTSINARENTIYKVYK